MSRRIRSSSSGIGSLAGMQCGCMIAVVILNLTLGSMSVNYLLRVWFEKDISWIGDMIIGLFVAELSIPAAIVTWLLIAFGAM